MNAVMLLCVLSVPASDADADAAAALALAVSAAAKVEPEKRCPVRGSSCPCGCRDGDPCTCAAAKARRPRCNLGGCRCEGERCGYCVCQLDGPCNGSCVCPPDRPEWHEMEAGGLGLYGRPGPGGDWVLFGYWDGARYWNYLRDGKGWGEPRESPPVKPPETRQGRRVPPPAAPTPVPGASLPSLTFPPAWAPARPADC